jgi:acyl-CoA synthetase (AMP-forming)/AMP-acid ligase II
MIGLLDWLEEPTSERGLRAALPHDEWSWTPYTQLRDDVLQAAEQLAERDLERGSVVVLMLGSEREFAAAFFACLLTGATPCPIPTPIAFRDSGSYIGHVAGIMRVAKAPVILVDEMLEPLAADSLAEAGTRGAVVRLQIGKGERAARDPEQLRRPAADLALLQFTSGSTGTPKGVRVTWSNLEHNIHAIRRWIGVRPDDVGATWLPLYHDMGLIGGLLTPIMGANDLWQMAPTEFIRDPARWLRCMGMHGATSTPAPNFGFAYAARRVRPQQLEGCDFSGWRSAIIGSDRVDAEALSRFTALLEPFGFRRETFVPAYGLAEATLAVTGIAPDQVAQAVKLGDGGRAFGEQVDVQARAQLGDAPPSDGAWMTSCGRPLDGVEVTIVGEDGEELPEGRLGEIVVGGGSVARGYLLDGDAVMPFEADRLGTADAGFMLGGELYVLGRIGDSLKVRGRSVYAEDVEVQLAAIDGIAAGRCAVVFGSADRVPSAVAIVESEQEGWRDDALALMRRVTDPSVRIRLLRARRGTIPRTSSGKPRRRVIWRSLLDGDAFADVVYDGAPS